MLESLFARLQVAKAARTYWLGWAIPAALVLVLCRPAGAQTAQLLPELDTYLKLDPDVRVWFQAKGTREGGTPFQAEIGPSLDFYIKSLPRLDELATFDLDKSKSKLVVLSIGYRYLPQANHAPGTNRIEPVATFQVPLRTALLLSDRDRFDFDWQNGAFTWRYRNRFQIERTFGIGSLHVIPYLSSEFFYESLYQKWATTALYGGFYFPIGSKVQFNPYYEHENNTGLAPNHQVNALGLMLNLFLSAH